MSKSCIKNIVNSLDNTIIVALFLNSSIMGVTEKTRKASVSIREHNWEVLSKAPNKSKIINKALDLYFDFEEKKKQNYEEWYANFIAETIESLAEVDRGETTPVPMKDGKIDFEAFEKELWS